MHFNHHHHPHKLFDSGFRFNSPLYLLFISSTDQHVEEDVVVGQYLLRSTGVYLTHKIQYLEM